MARSPLEHIFCINLLKMTKFLNSQGGSPNPLQLCHTSTLCPCYAGITLFFTFFFLNFLKQLKRNGNYSCQDLMYTLKQHETLNASFLVRNFQMGSTMKRSIFDQQASKALKNWHKKAVKKTNEGKPGQLQTRTLGGSPDASSVHSPSLTPPRPMKFGTEDPDFTDVEADKMATVDLDANHQRRPSDSSFPFDHQDLLS